MTKLWMKGKIYETRDRVEKPKQSHPTRWKCDVFPAVGAGIIKAKIDCLKAEIK